MVTMALLSLAFFALLGWLVTQPWSSPASASRPT
jgi:hypothetical protein